MIRTLVVEVALLGEQGNPVQEVAELAIDGSGHLAATLLGGKMVLDPLLDPGLEARSARAAG